MSDITKTVDTASSGYRPTASSGEPEVVSFDLGEHPSEVLARRAVWSWLRRKWWQSLTGKLHETHCAKKELENIDAVVESGIFARY